MALILVRHTRPDVATGLCYGRLDVGLADTFLDEAAVVLSGLPAVRRIVSSPLSRCRKLAHYLAAASDLPLAFDERLTEMDFGAWEGRLWSALPASELDTWAKDFMHARPHGGESVAMLSGRVADALADWSVRREPIALVTHSGVIKAAFSAQGTQPRDFASSVDFGGIMALAEGDGNATRRLDHD